MVVTAVIISLILEHIKNSKLMRYAARLEYNGSLFNGWQTQKHGTTIQQIVEKALSKVANCPVKTICAGRTDTGVHALGQIIHFDTNSVRSNRSWVHGTNANLPKSIAVIWAQQVPDDFHARFSVIRRRYRYVVFNRRIRPTVLQNRVTWECRDLSLSPMIAATKYLEGEHDFTSYRARACQSKNPIRHIHRINVNSNGSFYFLDIEANGFLYHMVRNIAGVLLSIGRGEREPIWAKQVLQAKDREQGGITAPPDGLYFLCAIYPEQYTLPSIDDTEFLF